MVLEQVVLVEFTQGQEVKNNFAKECFRSFNLSYNYLLADTCINRNCKLKKIYKKVYILSICVLPFRIYWNLETTRVIVQSNMACKDVLQYV